MSGTTDFARPSLVQSTNDSVIHLDVDLSDLLGELEGINVKTVAGAAIQASVFAPLRYRTGEILYVKDFEYGAGHMATWTSGAGAASQLDTTYWLTKGQSWHLVAGSDSGKQAWLQIVLGRLPLGDQGVEFSFAFDGSSDQISLYFEPVYNSTYLRYALRFDITNDQVSIRDDNGVYQVVRDPMALYGGVNVWHFVKLIVDSSGQTYTTLFIDEEEIDLSAYAVATGSASADTYLEVRFVNLGAGGDNPDVYIDMIALTEE